MDSRISQTISLNGIRSANSLNCDITTAMKSYRLHKIHKSRFVESKATSSLLEPTVLQQPVKLWEKFEWQRAEELFVR